MDEQLLNNTQAEDKEECLTPNENTDQVSQNESSIEQNENNDELFDKNNLENCVLEENGIDEGESVDASPDTESNEKEQKIFCSKCGAELSEDQLFCPKCGQKIGEKTEKPVEALGIEKRSLKKKIGIIVGVIAAAAVLAIIAVVFLRGKQAKEITLNKEAVTVKVGETVDLTFTINPEDTKDKTVSWTSSNEAIAAVDEGRITAKNEGDCIITASTKNGKTDTCSVLVEAAGPDFNFIFKQYCKSSFASVASDGSYLNIDTNPNDKDEYTDYDAYIAILGVNEALGLPESVTNRMGQTRSIDGRQSAQGDGFEVSWIYHPDHGLEVAYELTK